MTDNLSGVKVDYVTIDQAGETVEKWLEKKGKHYIVTPNPEMIVDSKFDASFKTALNKAHLAIADSPRLGWGSKVQESKSPFIKLIRLPFFLFPQIITGNIYPTTRGTDLMEKLIKLSEEKAYTTAYLGGSQRVAVNLFNCLRRKHPKLKISFCSGNIDIDEDGNNHFDMVKDKMTMSKNIKTVHLIEKEFNAHSLSQKIDILFLAFGHKKQEKWMYKNLPKLNTRVMVGVGGAFDYLSGVIPRAPKIIRVSGLEWVFRLIIQPWRIKRFWKLPYFLYMVMTSK